MDGSRDFRVVDFDQSIGHTAVPRTPRVAPNHQQTRDLLFIVLRDVRQAESRKPSRTTQPIARVTANQSRSQLGVLMHSGITIAVRQLAFRQLPEQFVDSHVELPQASLAALVQLLVNARDVEFRDALQPVVDQQIGIQIRDHGRPGFHGRQPVPNAGQQPGIVRQIRGTEHMVADLVSQNLAGEAGQSFRCHLSEADDHGMIDQPNHGEAAGKLFAFFFGLGEAPLRLVKLDEAAPECE